VNTSLSTATRSQGTRSHQLLGLEAHVCLLHISPPVVIWFSLLLVRSSFAEHVKPFCLDIHTLHSDVISLAAGHLNVSIGACIILYRYCVDRSTAVSPY